MTLASSVLLAGHVTASATVRTWASEPPCTSSAKIGRGAMVGMASAVTRDVPPFAKAYGNPASVRGANVVGMKRSGVDAEVIRVLTGLYGAAGSPDVRDSASLDAIEDVAVREAVARWVHRER